MGNPTGRIFLMGTSMEWYYPTGIYSLPSLVLTEKIIERGSVRNVYIKALTQQKTT
jgi:hypothetical protein